MAQQEGRTVTAGKNDAGRRFDRVCRKLLGNDLPLSSVYAGIRKGKIRVNGKKAKPSFLLKEGDEIFIRKELIPEEEKAKPREREEKPAERKTGLQPSLIVYENEHILVLNKPPGVLTHGKGSLQETAEGYLEKEARDSLSFSPAPLHRLDRNTSGLLVFGKSIDGSRVFSELLRTRELLKVYLGVHHGVIGEDRFWEDRLTRNRQNRRTRVADEGERAALSVHPLLSSSHYGLSLFVLHTGRTHQIRVQSSFRGHPIAGDRKYGGKQIEGHLLLLHACMLFFNKEDPVLGIQALYAPPPERFRSAARALLPPAEVDTCLTKLPEKIMTKISSIS
jgi:23S rRNA pseudouridine955/2504/2580 synthase